VGLVQRELEAAGFTTVTLSPIPDFTASVSAPRVVGIEYPLGRSLGQPGDVAGQMAVLRDTLHAVETMDTPGSVQNLPYRWPETPKAMRAQKSTVEPPPIAGHLMRNPWQIRRFLQRNPPD
jgi:D-proline reductase (dithiol) PrdB